MASKEYDSPLVEPWQPISERMWRILWYVRKHPGCTTMKIYMQIVPHLRGDLHCLYVSLRRLQRRGLVRSERRPGHRTVNRHWHPA